VRVQEQRAASDWRARILHPSAKAVAAAAVLFVVDQFVYQQVGTFVPFQAPLDWTNHLLTTLFIAWALRPLIDRRRILAALIMSVAIDADHIPGYLGSHILTGGDPRPYTHSLATVAVLLAVAALRPNWRGWASGAGLGVLSHLWRDLAEPQGTGVSLFWPVSDRVVTTPAALYFGSIVVLATVALIRAWASSRSATLAQQRRASAPGSEGWYGRKPL
jgi:inner membrane protein